MWNSKRDPREDFYPLRISLLPAVSIPAGSVIKCWNPLVWDQNQLEFWGKGKVGRGGKVGKRRERIPICWELEQELPTKTSQHLRWFLEPWKFLLPKQTKPIHSGPVLPPNHLPATFCFPHSFIPEFTWEDESEFPAFLSQGTHHVFHGFISVVQAALLPYQPALLVALDSSCPWVGASVPPGEQKILHQISINSIKTRPCSCQQSSWVEKSKEKM